MEKTEVRKMVREGYAEVARKSASCCGEGGVAKDIFCAEAVSGAIGYTDEEMRGVPEGANLGLGCGNPIAHASLKEGEVVIDLGSGAGFDCFIAAKNVGQSGRVIGVDMTHEMLEKARKNAGGNYANVEFRLGEIENLPVADSTADIVISNCVINLSPDKARVFREACRVLKAGGRLMVSDIVLERDMPPEIRKSASAYIGCISGAIRREDYIRMIRTAGFDDVDVVEEKYYAVDYIVNDPSAKVVIGKLSGKERDELNHAVKSIRVRAVKRRKASRSWNLGSGVYGLK